MHSFILYSLHDWSSVLWKVQIFGKDVCGQIPVITVNMVKTYDDIFWHVFCLNGENMQIPYRNIQIQISLSD